MNKKIGLSGTDWGVYEDENVFITPDVFASFKRTFSHSFQDAYK